MNRIAVTLLLCCALSLFAGVKVLEQKPGYIKLEVTAQPYTLTGIYDSVRIDGDATTTVTNLKGEELPAFSFAIFTEDPSRAKLNYSIESSSTVPLKSPIIRGESAPTLGPLSPMEKVKLRDAAIYRWVLTPIISTSNGTLKQFTKATVTITYPPVKKSQTPSSPYYKSMARLALNPDEFFTTEPKRTVTAESRSSRSSAGSYIGINEKAAYFTIAGNPADETETNGEDDGLYRITPTTTAQAGLGTNLPIKSISIYTTNPFVDDSITPSINAMPDALLPVPAIYRDNNKDGVFNNQDEILFYASSMHFWNLKSQKWEYRFNDFTEKRHYFIRTTQGSHEFEQLTQPSTATKKVTSGLQLTRIKKSNKITTFEDPNNWADRQWVWSTITRENNLFKPDVLLDIGSLADTTKATEFRVVADVVKNKNFGSYSDSAFYTFNTTGGNSELLSLKSSAAFNDWLTLPLTTETFTLEVSGITRSIKDSGYQDIVGFDLSYFRQLTMQGMNSLRFYSNASDAPHTTASYTVTNINSDYAVVLRNNPASQEILLVDSISSETLTDNSFTWNDSTNKGYEYIVATASGAKTPTLQAVVQTTPNSSSSEFLVRDLHSTANRSDYMIVTPNELLSSSLEIAAHKKSVGTFFHPRVVTTEDIYREFSGGVPHPSAIRNFMVYIHQKWQTPLNGSDKLDYLLLIGAGHYDYKGIKTSAPNYIFPYIDRSEKNNAAVEDFFGLTSPGLYPGKAPQMAVGRVQANSPNDVGYFLDKLEYMESGIGDFSEWRNRLLFVADDDQTPKGYERLKHWEQSDDVVNIILSSSPTSHIQKVTLFEYERDGTLKPGAKIDLLNRINDGVSLMNFFGHGSYLAMTDETIFHINDIPTLKNLRKYMIFSAFSCSVGFFDLPGKECIAAKLITEKQKGAVSAVSSTRTSYSGPNERFAKAFYNEFYTPNQSTSIGLAYIHAKDNQYLEYYGIFGDPSYTPLLNNKIIELDIKDENGNSIDTMKAVQQVRVTATIPAGHNIDSIRLQIENPEQLDVRRKDGFDDFNPELKDTVTYDLPGKILLNQAFPVVNNQVNAAITIPPIVQQKVEGTKLRAYGWCNDKSTTVTGIKDSLYFEGTDYSNLDTTDKTGPTISIRLAQDTAQADTALPGSVGNRVVIDGFYIDPDDSTDVSQDPAVVELYFSDSSGIDIFGENVGEGINITLKDIRTAKNYNGDFRPIQESPNKGKITLTLRQDEFPRPGEYELMVTASDFLQNSTKERFVIEVKSTQQGLYDIGEFYAYPSPVHIGEQTRFYYNTPDFRVHRMTLKIFTLSGQLVRQFNDVRPGVQWDLKDQRGNQLSPNVYLYRLYVERDARESTDFISAEREKEIIMSPIRKMVIYPPR